MSWFKILLANINKILNREAKNVEYYSFNEIDFDPKFNNSNILENKLKYKTYYENQGNQTFESLLEDGGCLELELLYGDSILSDSFGFRNIGKGAGVTKLADLNFRYRSIAVPSEYRRTWVCNCLVLNSIIVVLENLKHYNIEFSLVNTVLIDIDDKFSVYNSVLTETVPKENMQYKVFLVKNRDSDLEFLQEQYNRKLKKLLNNLEGCN